MKTKPDNRRARVVELLRAKQEVMVATPASQWGDLLGLRFAPGFDFAAMERLLDDKITEMSKAL